MRAERAIRRDRGWLKVLAGTWTVVLAVLVAGAPWPFALVSLAPAAVAHAAVYDWSLRRPDAFPALAAFAVGMLLDVISGPAFGLGAMTCVLAHFSAAAQRRFLAPRGVGHAWIGLGLTAIALAPVAWAIASLYVLQFQPIGLTLAQAALTIALYPPLAIAFQAVRLALGLGGRGQ